MKSLKSYNSFGVDAKAARFFVVDSLNSLKTWRVAHPDSDCLILGEGSNILFVKNPDVWVLKNELKGIEVMEEDDETITLNVKSGENWHELVHWTVEKGYGGLENLALIPGSVGAAPVQNIGAYGVELKDRILGVRYFDLEKQQEGYLKTEDCEFSYRNSIFKSSLKNRAFIAEVRLLLHKKRYNVQLGYKALQNELKASGIETPSIRDVFEAVVRIRQSKLPDPDELGNAGSFFKNPVISRVVFEQLQLEYPDIPSYPVGDEQVKLAAGWLIEKSGLKGKRVGEVGTYEKQALVIVNYGEASGLDIFKYATRVKAAVFAKFAVVLEEEVNLIK